MFDIVGGGIYSRSFVFLFSLAEILVMGQISDADFEFEKKLSKKVKILCIYIYMYIRSRENCNFFPKFGNFG